VTSPDDIAVVAQMQTLVQQWEKTSDPRAIFLTCYLMMTRNMRSAIDRREFTDADWVAQLLRRFADYYFVALAAYDQDPAAAPPVWQLAHDAARDPHTLALQKLLLGVNAHINYDLVLTLVELLQPEWAGLTAERCAARYKDYCRVNDVIGHTIDAVQDQVIEPAMPLLDVLDKLMGRVDELLISRLITHWREAVWQNAARLLDTSAPDEQARVIRQVEQEALRLGHILRL